MVIENTTSPGPNWEQFLENLQILPAYGQKAIQKSASADYLQKVHEPNKADANTHYKDTNDYLGASPQTGIAAKHCRLSQIKNTNKINTKKKTAGAWSCNWLDTTSKIVQLRGSKVSNIFSMRF